MSIFSLEVVARISQFPERSVGDWLLVCLPSFLGAFFAATFAIFINIFLQFSQRRTKKHDLLVALEIKLNTLLRRLSINKGICAQYLGLRIDDASAYLLHFQETTLEDKYYLHVEHLETLNKLHSLKGNLDNIMFGIKAITEQYEKNTEWIRNYLKETKYFQNLEKDYMSNLNKSMRNELTKLQNDFDAEFNHTKELLARIRVLTKKSKPSLLKNICYFFLCIGREFNEVQLNKLFDEEKIKIETETNN